MKIFTDEDRQTILTALYNSMQKCEREIHYWQKRPDNDLKAEQLSAWNERRQKAESAFNKLL